MTDADYADDIAITTNNNKNTELMFQQIEKIAKYIRLQVNTDKIGYMSINRDKKHQ